MNESKHNKLSSVCLVVLNNFANDSRVLKEAISLNKTGYKVLVLAMLDRGQLSAEMVNGVQVQRIYLKTRSLLKIKPVQLIKYFEFLIKAYSIARKYDIIHCNDLNALPIGVLCKFFHSSRVVYDAHEFEINRIPNQSKFSIRMLYLLEKSLIGFADKVLTVSESIAVKYSEIYGIPKPELILNCPPMRISNVKANKFRDEFGISQDSEIFLYQGALSKGRGIEYLIDVFCRDEYHNLVLVFMGYGVLQNQIQDVADKYDRIFYKSAVSPDQVLVYTLSADYGISLIEDSSLSYRFCLPNKIFEYIMVGIPIIVSDLPEMKRVVEEYKVGVVIGSSSENDFIPAFIGKIGLIKKSDLDDNFTKARNVFNWENQEKKLISIYNDL